MEGTSPEVINRGQWSPGQSGNPEGITKRALIETLQMLSEFDSYEDLAYKRLPAQLIWARLVSGQIHMVGGKTMDLKGKDRVERVKDGVGGR